MKYSEGSKSLIKCKDLKVTITKSYYYNDTIESFQTFYTDSLLFKEIIAINPPHFIVLELQLVP